MLHEIAPRNYDGNFRFQEPKETDLMLIYHRDQVLLQAEAEGETLPTYKTVLECFPALLEREPVYLLSVNDRAFFLVLAEELPQREGFAARGTQAFRELWPRWMAFGAVTAAHLGGWYESNRICGRCGTPMEHSDIERAVRCPDCGLLRYPQIAPVIIVGVTNGDKLLMTRYAHGGYRRHALIAGFCEIGEDLEGTVHREVMEEVGLRVKNIRYYKSQPWGFSGSLIAGFFADLDGDDHIEMDETELAEAVWVPRKEIPTNMSDISVTYELVEAFREDRMPH